MLPPRRNAMLMLSARPPQCSPSEYHTLELCFFSLRCRVHRTGTLAHTTSCGVPRPRRLRANTTKSCSTSGLPHNRCLRGLTPVLEVACLLALAELLSNPDALRSKQHPRCTNQARNQAWAPLLTTSKALGLQAYGRWHHPDPQAGLTTWCVAALHLCRCGLALLLLFLT